MSGLASPAISDPPGDLLERDREPAVLGDSLDARRRLGAGSSSSAITPSRPRSIAPALGPRRFRTVVGLVATATRAGGRDGSCLFAVYTELTRAGRVVSGSTSLRWTSLF